MLYEATNFYTEDRVRVKIIVEFEKKIMGDQLRERWFSLETREVTV